MSIDTVVSLVDALNRYRLLEPDQLEELTRTLQGKHSEPRGLVRELVQRGWLSPFQVNQLFQDKGAELQLGSYLLLARLGEGGMGQVYKARHQKLGRIVALKVIREDRLRSAEALWRFQREIRATAQLSHPNVVHSYDADQIGNRHLIVMEYVDGIDLGQLIHERGPLPVALACDYIRQAARGLQHAHEHGLVHRDVKPSNLLLTPRRQGESTEPATIKLLDLGLARLTAGDDDSTGLMTQDGMLVGTPDYIAPEQARSAHSADIRADLYSLGCTMFYLLLGRPPFLGDSITDKLLKHCWEAPPRLGDLRSDVPPIVAALVNKLLAKGPEERFQTPHDLVEALDRVLAPGGFEAPAPPEWSVKALPPPPDDALRTAPAPVVPAPPAPAGKRSFIAANWPWLVAGGAAGGGLLVVVIALLLYASWPRGDVARTTRKSAPPASELALSPLDKLNRDAIAKVERVSGQPREIVALLGEHRARHFGSVTGVAWAPDGRTVFSAGDDGVVRMWEAATLQPRGTLGARNLGLVALAAAPLARKLAAVDAVGTLMLWDLANKPAEPTILDKERAVALALSADGTLLAVAREDRTVQLWQLASAGKPQVIASLGGHRQRITKLAFAPEDKLLASASADFTVRLYDLPGGKLRAVLPSHDASVSAVAFSPDGRLLASGCADATIRFWELGASKPTLRGLPLGVSGAVNSLAFAPQGQLLLCGLEDRSLSVFDVAPEEPRLLAGVKDSSALVAAVWSRTGDAVVSGSYGGTVRVWDWTDDQLRERVALRGHTGWVDALAFTPDGKTLASGSYDRSVRLWDLNGAEPKEHAVLDGKGGGISSLSFSPDGKRLAAASAYDPYLRLWTMPASELPKRWRLAQGNDVVGGAVAFAPDGRTLAAAGQIAAGEGTIRLYDVRRTDPELLQSFRGHTDRVISVGFLPDGQALVSSGGGDETVRLWERSGKREPRSFRGPKGAVGPAVVAPVGKLLAFSSRDSFIRLWDLAPNPPRELSPFPSHADVAILAFAPDGKKLASADDEGGLILWDMSTRKPARDWRLPGPVYALAFAPDGRHLAVGNANGTIYVLRLASAPQRTLPAR